MRTTDQIERYERFISAAAADRVGEPTSDEKFDLLVLHIMRTLEGLEGPPLLTTLIQTLINLEEERDEHA
jgi:hypothetical protein